MKKITIVILSLVAFVFSCEKETINYATIDYVHGQVKEISEGTNNINSFALHVVTPGNVNYEVLVNDTTVMKDFVVNKKATLKVSTANELVQATKVISTDSDSFTLKGIITEKELNSPGYTASVNGPNNEVYRALFSKSNLNDKFKDYNVADTITVKGELYVSNNTLHFTVKDIL